MICKAFCGLARYARLPLSGCAIGHAYGVRVLKMDRPAAGGFLSLTAFQAEGCGIALSGDEHEVSVTGLSL